MTTKIQTRRYDISVLRVISMLLIILCHIIKNYTFVPFSEKLSEVFNAGVYTFLGISGYLFGMKHIERFKEWILARVKRIWLPVFLLVTVDIVFLKIISNVDISVRQAITYTLNLQGLMFLNWRWFSGLLGGEITNLGPLWFMTVIMLCYLFVPLLQFIKERTKWCWVVVLIFSFVGFGLIDITTGFHGFYFAAFASGYFLSAYHSENKSLGFRKVIVISAAVLLMQIGRVLLQKTMDDSTVYHIYIGYSHSALGLVLLLIMSCIRITSDCLPLETVGLCKCLMRIRFTFI